MSDFTRFGFRKLGVDNYSSWYKHMKGLLATKGYLTALTDPNDANREKAKGLMLMCVQECHLTLVETAPNAQAAWQALANLYRQQSTANVLRLKREFINLEMTREENITVFISRVSELREKVEVASGNRMPDTDVICAILNALPTKYAVIKTFIESMPALPTLAEVTAKLLMVEANQPRGNDKAFYTSINKSTYSEEQPTCYYCKEKGHIMRDCYQFKADKEVPNNYMRSDSGATRHVHYL
jgi:hypothetical protein